MEKHYSDNFWRTTVATGTVAALWNPPFTPTTGWQGLLQYDASSQTRWVNPNIIRQMGFSRCLTDVSVGGSNTERIGNEVWIEDLNVKLLLQNATQVASPATGVTTAQDTCGIRVVVVQDKQGNASESTMAWNTVFGNAAAYSEFYSDTRWNQPLTMFQNPNLADRFKILHDSVHFRDTQSANGRHEFLELNIKNMNRNIRYSNTSDNGSLSNQIYLLYAIDTNYAGASGVGIVDGYQIWMQSRMTFTNN